MQNFSHHDRNRMRQLIGELVFRRNCFLIYSVVIMEDRSYLIAFPAPANPMNPSIPLPSLYANYHISIHLKALPATEQLSLVQ